MGSPTSEPAATGTAVVLEEVNLTHGSTYRLVRPLLGGFQSGAWLIQDDARRTGVLKWTCDRTWARQVQRASRAVARIRQRGYPTPAWLAVGTTSSGYGYQVQRYVPGTRREHLTEHTAYQAVSILELQTGLDPDPDRCWSDYLTSTIHHERASMITEVSATGVAGTELSTQAAQLVSRYDVPVFPRSDLVHGDFRLANVIFDDDTVRGVIDIEALGSGTRAFDYATLLDHELADDTAVELLVAAGSQVAGPAVLAHCFAHVVLDLALFVHRHPLTAGTDQADQRMRSLGARADLVSRLLI